MEQRSTSLREDAQGAGNRIKKLSRDIKESLGKLPPQAPEVEEQVIAHLMQDGTVHLVEQFLRPEHFYVEAHVLTYRAILNLYRRREPTDMVSVAHEMKETGHLEPAGGHIFLAQVLRKATSAASIVYHARIIVEMWLKRDLIQLASQVHHDAYEDTTDVFELRDRIRQRFEDIGNITLSETPEARVKALWESRLIVEEPAEPPPLIKIGETPIAIAGNHTLIVGKKKSRKTLFIVWLISEFLKANPKASDEVILFDTEQGKGHVYRLRAKIEKICGKKVAVHYLRGLTHKERVEYITQTIKIWPKKPKIVVLDGIRDLMADINDSDESNQLIYWLEKTSLEHDIHIFNVLHLNKTDKNPRGHIGTELTNKALATIELELDEKSGHTIVKCESSREKGFDNFAFTHGIDGGPEIVGMPVAGNSLPANERVKRIQTVFEDDEILSYGDLIDKICAEFAIGISKAKQLIREFVRLQWIMKSGMNGKTAMYKLASPRANAENTELVVTPIEAPPPGLFAENPETAADQVQGNDDDLPF